MTLHEILGIDPARRPIVSICGAGGKTTLMHLLAHEARPIADTAILTTTHIRRPEGKYLTVLDPLDRTACAEVWRLGRIAAAGHWNSENCRFGCPPEEDMVWLLAHTQATYIEADGSRRLPLKFPAVWEPVLRPETTHIVVLTGLSALSCPTAEVLHRTELAHEALGIDVGGQVDEELMARVLWAGYGHYDPVFVLNQADLPGLRARGETVAALLREYGARRVVVVALHDYSLEDFTI